MKTLKYILLGVIFSSLAFSTYSQVEKVSFCETYTKQEVLAKLDPEDSFFTLADLEETDPESSRIAYCHEKDLESLMNYVRSETFQDKVQGDLIIVAGAEVRDQMNALYAIRKSPSDKGFPSSQDLQELSVKKSEQEDNYALLLTFSDLGAEKWAGLTRTNIGRDIAILYDGHVIAAPRVREEIKNGKCMISGKFSEDEINKLKSALEN